MKKIFFFFFFDRATRTGGNTDVKSIDVLHHYNALYY